MVNASANSKTPRELLEAGLISAEEYERFTGQKAPNYSNAVKETFVDFKKAFNENLSKAPVFKESKKVERQAQNNIPENHGESAQTGSNNSAKTNSPEQKLDLSKSPFAVQPQHLNNNQFNSSSNNFNYGLSNSPSSYVSLSGGFGSYIRDKLSFGGNMIGNAFKGAKDYLSNINTSSFSAAVAGLGNIFAGKSESEMSGYVNTDTAWCARLMSKEYNDVSLHMFGKKLMPNFESVNAMRNYFKENGAAISPANAIKHGNLYAGMTVFFDRPGPGEHVGHISDVMVKDGKTFVQVNQGNYADKAQSDKARGIWRELVQTDHGAFITGITGGGKPLQVLAFGDVEKLIADKFGSQLAMERNIDKKNLTSYSSQINNHNYDLAEAPAKSKSSKHPQLHS